MATSNIPKRQGIMLCTPLSDPLFKNLPEKFYIQPKLRGERAWVFWQQGEAHLISSYGNEFLGLGHINEELRKHPQLPYDGELYVHGWSQEEINSACNRKKNFNPERSSKMEFHVFDIKEDNQDFAFRTNQLHNLHRFNGIILKTVSTHWVKKESFGEYLTETMENGYEGVVIRTLEGRYEEKRSKNVFKFKPTEADIYQIIGVKEGKGWAKGMVGAFVVIDNQGSVFEVGTGPALSKELRRKWMKMDVVGCWLKVKHERLKTRNQIPLCAVALEVIKKF